MRPRVVGAADPLDERLRGRVLRYVQHALLHRRGAAPDASRSCAGPGRAASRVRLTSPAISPHTAIGLPCLVGRRDRLRERAAAPPGAADRRGAPPPRRRGRRQACTGSGRWCRSTGNRASSGRSSMREHRGRDLDHAADLDAGSNGTPCSSQPLLRLRDQRRASGRSRSTTRASAPGCAPCRSATARRMARSCVRNMRGSARQKRTARRPSAGFGRDAREAIEPVHLLVGAEVERADRDRLAFHALGHAAVRLELLVLGRQRLRG